MSNTTLDIQFDYGDGNLTYQRVKWERIPCIGETVHIRDANSREYIRRAFWVVVQVTWSVGGPSKPGIIVVPEDDDRIRK